MQTISRKFIHLPLQMLALSIFVVLTLFIFQGNKGFGLSDEGFLWYGVQRVMLGEVPIRDFMAYDPGRYYWSAALMSLWGDNGIMPLRVSCAIFEIIGLFVSLLLIAGTAKKQNIFYLLLSAITLVAWMFVYYKQPDISISILLIGILAFLIEIPIRRNYFFAGLGLGMVAVFGRNHGIYGLLASLGVMLWIRIGQRDSSELVKGLAVWVAGVVVGFMPILLMAMFIPGFASAFWKSILFLFEAKATNLPLPVPSPWSGDFATMGIQSGISQVLLGMFFFATVIFGVFSIIWVVMQRFYGKKVSSALVAASFLALPYAHYAYSRADITHLALGIFPLLIGCLALLSTLGDKIKWPLALLLCVSSLWVTTRGVHPGWQCLKNNRCTNIEIFGSNLLVNTADAGDVELLRKLVHQYTPEGQNFLVTPYWPGAYALFQRKSPNWEICALFSRSQSFEQAEIERIKTANPALVLIFDYALDGRDELRFKNTHPVTYQFIQNNFERIPGSPNASYQIYKAKNEIQ